MEKFIEMKTSRIVALLFLAVLFFCNCANKKYGYTYLDENEASGKATTAPFKANDFKLSVRLALDTILLDKTTPSTFKVHVKLSGQYQYWPMDIKLNVWCNDKPVPLKAIDKPFSVSSVINGRVEYMNTTAPDFNIPLLIENIRKKYNLPDSVHYFKLTSGLESEPVIQDENAETIQVKVLVKWKGGSEALEKTYRLTKVDITKYPVRSRLYG
jgi:hypothetical protein